MVSIASVVFSLLLDPIEGVGVSARGFTSAAIGATPAIARPIMGVSLALTIKVIEIGLEGPEIQGTDETVDLAFVATVTGVPKGKTDSLGEKGSSPSLAEGGPA